MLKRFFQCWPLVFTSVLGAEPLPVSAIEYPPFTTNSEQEFGSAFVQLKNALEGSGLVIEANFLPPARAHKSVREGRWCASFYPARQPVAENEVVISLDREMIHLGLYRQREASPFVWQSLNEFEGKRIAKLRSVLRDGVGLELEQAGSVLLDVETFEQGLGLLKLGRVDYVFGDSVSGPLLMERLGLDARDYQFSTSTFESVPTRIWLNLNCAAAQRAYEHLQPLH